MLSWIKYKSTEIGFAPVYFNLSTKTVINYKLSLNKLTFQLVDYYQEVLT